LIQVEIEIPENEWSDAMLVLYDLQGKTLYKAQTEKGTNNIIAPASSGSYILSLYVRNKLVESEKIIVGN